MDAGERQCACPAAAGRPGGQRGPAQRGNCPPVPRGERRRPGPAGRVPAHLERAARPGLRAPDAVNADIEHVHDDPRKLGAPAQMITSQPRPRAPARPRAPGCRGSRRLGRVRALIAQGIFALAVAGLIAATAAGLSWAEGCLRVVMQRAAVPPGRLLPAAEADVQAAGAARADEHAGRVPSGVTSGERDTPRDPVTRPDLAPAARPGSRLRPYRARFGGGLSIASNSQEAFRNICAPAEPGQALDNRHHPRTPTQRYSCSRSIRADRRFWAISN